MGNVFDDGGYIGFAAPAYRSTLSVTAGAGATVTSVSSISWTHVLSSNDTYIIMAISSYSGYDDVNGAGWVGTATFNGVAMTPLKLGYRLAVYGAPVSGGTGARSVTYEAGSGALLNAAANSISIGNAVGLGTAGYSGSDGGTHAITGTGNPNTLLAFFTGQAYGSAAPTTPAGATYQFWHNQSSSAVGCYTATVPAGGSVGFSVATGQWGSAVSIPVYGRAA